MGRSQVEFNRKHGRGRGRGRGGKQQTQQPQQSNANSSSNATHNNSNVPSYLAPTSASAGKSKRQQSSSNKNARPHRASASPGRSLAKQANSTWNASVTTNTTDNTEHHFIPPHIQANTENKPHRNIVASPAPPGINAVLQRADPPVEEESSTVIMDDQPLPDDDSSPPQRTATKHNKATTNNNNNTSIDPTILLYTNTTHMAIPKPTDTPIFQLHLQATPMSRALQTSLPWYQRWRLPPRIARAVHWHDDEDKYGQEYTRVYSHQYTHNNNDDPLVELSTSALPHHTESSSADGNSHPHNPHSQNATTTTTSGNFSSRMLQRAREKKRNKDVPVHVAATSTAALPTTAPAADLATSYSDVTTPTDLVASSTLTVVPSQESISDAKLEAWLESTLLESREEEDGTDMAKGGGDQEEEEEDMEDWLDQQIGG